MYPHDDPALEVFDCDEPSTSVNGPAPISLLLANLRGELVGVFTATRGTPEQWERVWAQLLTVERATERMVAAESALAAERGRVAQLEHIVDLAALVCDGWSALLLTPSMDRHVADLGEAIMVYTRAATLERKP